MKKKSEFNFDLKQLRSFLEVLKENSFTKTSRNLRVGQATISNHINLLEDMLGVKLINRTSKEFTITEEGKIFRSFCEKLFVDIERLNSELKKGIFGGITKISSSTIPSTYIIPRIISNLKKKYPDYFYSIKISDSREVVEIIKEGNAEVGVVGKKIKHPLLLFQKALGDEIVLIGPMDFPDTIKVADITTLPLIIRESGSGTRNTYEAELKKHNIIRSNLNIVFECSTSESLKESVVAGLGAAFISKLAIKKELDSGSLKIIKIQTFKISRNFYIVYLKNKTLSYPAKLFIEEILKSG